MAFLKNDALRTIATRSGLLSVARRIRSNVKESEVSENTYRSQGTNRKVTTDPLAPNSSINREEPGITFGPRAPRSTATPFSDSEDSRGDATLFHGANGGCLRLSSDLRAFYAGGDSEDSLASAVPNTSCNARVVPRSVAPANSSDGASVSTLASCQRDRTPSLP